MGVAKGTYMKLPHACKVTTAKTVENEHGVYNICKNIIKCNIYFKIPYCRDKCDCTYATLAITTSRRNFSTCNKPIKL